jgi:hypothetical protein
MNRKDCFRQVIVVLVAISYATAMFAQEAGPLGFEWGAGPDQKSSKTFVLLQTDPSISNDDIYECNEAALSEPLDTPDDWRLKYKHFTEINSVEVEGNYAGANPSMGGRLKAFTYKVEIFGSYFNVCGLFFDERLYTINISSKRITTEGSRRELIEKALDSNYGPGDVSCSTRFCIFEWLSKEKKIKIDWVTFGSLRYVYAPIKAEQMEAWAQYYEEYIGEKTSNTDL